MSGRTKGLAKIVDKDGVELFTQSEAARLLGVTRSAVGHAIERGRMATRTVGGAVFITVAELERYRQENQGNYGPRRRLPRCHHCGQSMGDAAQRFAEGRPGSAEGD